MRAAALYEALGGAAPLLLALCRLGRAGQGRGRFFAALLLAALWLPAGPGAIPRREALLPLFGLLTGFLYAAAILRWKPGRALRASALLNSLILFSNGAAGFLSLLLASCLPPGGGAVPGYFPPLAAALPLLLLQALLPLLPKVLDGKGRLPLLLCLLAGAALRAAVLKTGGAVIWGAMGLCPSRQAAAALGPLLLAAACLPGAGWALSSQRRAAQGALLKKQAAYIKTLQERAQGLRIFAHDWNHHLLALSRLLQAGEEGEALRYLSALHPQAQALTSPPALGAGSPAVCALLAAKLQEAGQAGIRIECRCRIPEQIRDSDACRLLANALDNALRAAGEAQGEARYIRLESGLQGSLFWLSVENGCTLSREKIREGTGLLSMRRVAGAYRGSLCWQKQGGRFCLRLLLHIS